MSFSIKDFKGQFKNGGARPSLFEVTINKPGPGSGPPTANGDTAPNREITSDIRFFVEAAQIPASNLGVIQVPYFGRIVKLAGDRQFEPWTVTILNDEDFKVRNALEAWSSSINLLEANVRQNVYKQESNYKAQAFVKQYDKNGIALRTYKFEGMFPQTIGAIDLSWEALDQVERFQVTFEYDYFVVDSGQSSGTTSVADSLKTNAK